ncbi:sporulation protein YabP [Alicyclobacillus sp. ALC3]|uniref:sporulation protein YabP n=1 Tax=Alicyclobacillus sp. ALC3 TaxID=2796143 RepID=UPI002379DDFD|nr:sporulation protein YabP [Alicyclobacillus sp. ALC3]WDL98985.1 sporulation protein YabP [Alicyclobacillus sp. ALC3]
MSDETTHDIHISGRKQVEVTGISSVDSFDANSFVLTTKTGPLHIRGAGLHMRHLDLQTGVVIIEGTVSGLEYASEQNKRRRLTGRLLR